MRIYRTPNFNRRSLDSIIPNTSTIRNGKYIVISKDYTIPYIEDQCLPLNVATRYCGIYDDLTAKFSGRGISVRIRKYNVRGNTFLPFPHALYQEEHGIIKPVVVPCYKTNESPENAKLYIKKGFLKKCPNRIKQLILENLSTIYPFEFVSSFQWLFQDTVYMDLPKKIMERESKLFEFGKHLVNTLVGKYLPKRTKEQKSKKLKEKIYFNSLDSSNSDIRSVV